MRKFFTNVWRVITFPFRLIFNIIAFPFRLFARFRRYLNAEPEEHPLADVLTGLVTDKSMRDFLWEEIDIFRKHLLRAVLSVVIGIGIAFIFAPQLVSFLAIPIGGISKLEAIEVTEPIGVYMNVSLLAGIALASPYIAFEFWWFAAPGLRPRERRYGLFGIPMAAIFFIAGLAFTYYIMLPGALPWLLNILGFQTKLRPSSYFSFVTGLMFWIGVAFEYPLVIYFLTAMGFIKPKVLSQYWRQAVVIISIIAAVITPTWDPVNMGLVMLPMILLYFVSMGLSYLAYAGRRTHETPTASKE
ncbi:MAG TPA: twin-arginine translocase subunit TatC [Anaerolineales bacterium]|nr:twin-arginine translocase subunit TatC [Anaerolineales bacterium]